MLSESSTKKIFLSKLSLLQEGQPKIVALSNGERVAVVLWEGQVYAFEDRCTHDDGGLGLGKIAHCEIECPRHGARFNLKSGKATRMPGIVPIATYQVEIAGDDVWAYGVDDE